MKRTRTLDSTSAKSDEMASQIPSPEVVSAYLRAHLSELVRGGRTRVEIADSAGVTKAAIGQFLAGRMGAGDKMIRGLLPLLKMTRDELDAAARAWGETHPDELPRRATEIVRDDRYPNRSVAIEFARRDGRDERAIAEVLSRANLAQGDADLLPSEWLHLIERVERRLLRESAGVSTKHVPISIDELPHEVAPWEKDKKKQ